MKQAMLRDTFVEIIKSFSRFLAIVIIVALGVGFLYGIKATSPAMDYTADQYFDQQHYKDLRLVSTMGFTAEDAAELAKQADVADVGATYSLSALIESKNGLKTARLHALPAEGSGMDRPLLVDGRWPEQSGECLVDSKQAGVLGEIGSQIVLSGKNQAEVLDVLPSSRYTITGFVESPEYINYANRGAISIGEGSIYCFIYLPAENFQMDYYTDLLVEIKGTAELSCYSAAYRNLVAAASERLKAFAGNRVDIRYAELVREPNRLLDEAVRQLEDQRGQTGQELADAKDKIDQAAAAIDGAQREIDQKVIALDSAKAELTRQKNNFADQTAKAQVLIDQGAAELADRRKPYDEGMLALSQGKARLTEMALQIQAYINTGKYAEAYLLGLQRVALEAELATQEARLNPLQAPIKEAENELQSKRDQLASSKAQAAAQFAQAQKKIDQGEQAVEAGQTGLSRSKEDLAAARAEYERASREAKTSLDAAEAEIENMRRQIDLVDKPQWLMLSREDNADYASFDAAAKRIDALAAVFPVFFYLIAALVCLTTLTRMVEEQRTQMGVLRALGYSRGAIVAKYLVYAGAASLLGSMAGLLVGHAVLPYMIYRTYEYTYTIPPLVVPFNPVFALEAAGAAMLANMLAALWACYHEVSSVPAELIRPKAPLPGHRVLLEKIPFLWNRFSFLRKVTIRNLFRFKKRFFMTVLGISGCTALLLTGFGLRDSIAGTVPRQYYGLHSYHLFLNLISPASSADDSALNQSFATLLDDWLYATQIKMNINGLDKTMTTYLFVPEDPDKTGAFVSFRDRQSQEPLIFPQPGKVILTEKIADELHVKAGDMILLEPEDAEPVQVTVGGVTENYIYNYIFMSPEDYTAFFGRTAQYKMVLGKVAQGDSIGEARENELTARLLEQENVLSATTIASIRREFDLAMKNLDAVVLIIIICACLLNFVVLYNLININITERTREIATIKVLGFLKREVSAYINREIVLLMVFGILLGLGFGFFPAPVYHRKSRSRRCHVCARYQARKLCLVGSPDNPVHSGCQHSRAISPSPDQNGGIS